jgi:hypothetical protein
VHIDTGVLGLSRGGLMSAVQDLLVTPLWMALVWIVHALCVMLEWCFTLDLLDSPASGGIGRGLRRMQQALTDPWIPVVLSVACVLVLYDGLIRRRVADTIGGALLMVAMMVGGLWAIADPEGTVGALGGWANEASLGALAATASGTPSGTPKALGQSMRLVFSAAIEVPWCYLEFGNVAWCRNPAQTEPRLRAAGLKIAGEELAQAGCGSRSQVAAACPGLSSKGRALARSARLLREANSNGAIFLALPANGPERNSINDEGSLLRTICESSDATDCQGPAATEAEFRTGEQTWSRLGGLLLIAFGGLGMILLLAFLALRLLGASLFSLFYLLIAPGMVLAPALGEGGRAVFRRWAAQLIGAVVSKLLFSFLLGVVLGVVAILANLQALGWWTQWLLMSAFWWGAYARRHQALGLAEGTLLRHREVSGGPRHPRSLARRVGAVLETRKAGAAVRWARDRRSRGAPEPGPLRPRRTPSAPRFGRRAASAPPPSAESPPASRREPLIGQLTRIREAREAAEARGQRRRVAELTARAARVEDELRAAETQPRGAQGEGGRSQRPASRRTDGGHELAVHTERSVRIAPPAPPESIVMRDAREVEAKRKRFLGVDLP